MHKLIICVLSLVLFVQVVAADNVVYSFNGIRAQVVTVNSDGTDAQILLRGRGGVTGITYDSTGNNICWSETQSQRIVCSKTDGSDPVTVVSGLEAFRDLVVGPSSKIYFIDNASVKRVNIDGTGLETLVAGVGTLSGIDVEGTNIFYFDDATNTLYRSNLDGTGVTSLATIALFTAADIEVNATHIFLADSAGTIKRANIDGTGAADFITGLTYPAGLEIDSTNSKLLFTDSGTREVLSANLADGSGITTVIDSIAGPRDILAVPADNLLFVLDAERQSIYRSALNGTGLSEIVTGSPTDVGSIVFDDETGDFYTAEERPGQIVRYNNDGTNETVVLSGLVTPVDLEIYGGKVYYLLGNPDSIGRANLDGTGSETIIAVAAAGSIAINGPAEDFYWAESSTGNIYRTNLDGTGSALVTTINIAPTLVQPRGMVYCPSVDKLFVTEGTQGKIWSVPTDGTAPTSIINTASTPFQIQCDDVGHKIYWTESANTLKRSNFDGTSVETVADAADSVFFPKAIGLAFDADSDRTLNAADGCINDAGKIAPGICGCGRQTPTLIVMGQQTV